MRPLPLLTASLVSLLSLTALAEKPKPAWVAGVEEARENTFECFGKKDVEGCRRMVAGYQKAMKLAEGDASAQHEIFKHLVHAQGVWGGNLREKGELTRAIEVLDAAHGAMMAHYDDGKHFHTLIENLQMQREFVLAHAEAGDQAKADEALQLSREAADAMDARADQVREKEHQLQLVYNAIIRGEELEREVAQYYAKRAESRAGNKLKAKLAVADRERAAEAFQRSEKWLKRGLDEKISHPTHGYPDVRYAELKVGLGRVLLAHGDKAAAATELLMGAAVACPRSNPLSGMLLTNVCKEARALWSKAADMSPKETTAKPDEWFRDEVKKKEHTVPASFLR